MDFSTERFGAGLHVMIGDNGSGKSSILRAIAYFLVGPDNYLRLNPDLEAIIRHGETQGSVYCDIFSHPEDLDVDGKDTPKGKFIGGGVAFQKESNRSFMTSVPKLDAPHIGRTIWGDSAGWFSCGFGALRRMNGGEIRVNTDFSKYHKIAAHISQFNDGATFQSLVAWLLDLYTYSLEGNGDKKRLLDGIGRFLNRPGLLPDGFRFMKISASGPYFLTPNSIDVHLFELSDGIQTMVGMCLQIIRLLSEKFKIEEIFSNYFDEDPQNDRILTHGVVLIDEIDAHLHPSWQTRIGDWFTENFPNMQFIVTTHSPLICRAAEKGTIWHLYNEDGETKCKQVVGEEKDKLVYGSILDSVATGLFGDKTVQSDLAIKLLEEYARLETKALFQRLTESDAIRLKELQSKHLA